MNNIEHIEHEMQTKGEASMRGTYFHIRFILKAPGFFEVCARDRRSGADVTGTMSYDFMQGGASLCLDTKSTDAEDLLKRVLGDAGLLRQMAANGPVRFDDTPPKR